MCVLWWTDSWGSSNRNKGKWKMDYLIVLLESSTKSTWLDSWPLNLYNQLVQNLQLYRFPECSSSQSGCTEKWPEMQADGHKWNSINQSHVHRKAIKKLHHRSTTGVMLYLSNKLLRIYVFGNVHLLMHRYLHSFHGQVWLLSTHEPRERLSGPTLWRTNGLIGAMFPAKFHKHFH